MPKYSGKNYFAHGSFPEVGQKQKRDNRTTKIKNYNIFTILENNEPQRGKKKKKD